MTLRNVISLGLFRTLAEQRAHADCTQQCREFHGGSPLGQVGFSFRPGGGKQAIDALVTRDLVSRQRDESDRLQVRLLLTARGKAALADHSVLNAQRLGAVLSRLSERERAKAVEGLELLANAARATAKRARAKETR